MLIKYPSTPHLHFSESINEDDYILSKTNNLSDVISTIKYDGENISMYPDFIHARSLDSKDHISRHWVKSLHSEIKHLIPEGMIIRCENLFAKHSISYDNLDSYCYVFQIWQNNTILSWDETIDFVKFINKHSSKNLEYHKFFIVVSMMKKL